MKLKIEDLTTMQKCVHPTIGGVFSSCMKYSAELDTGINFIAGDVFSEGWMCSYALSKGRLRDVREGKFYLDGSSISLSDLRKMTWYVSFEELTKFGGVKLGTMLKLLGRGVVTERDIVRCFGLEESLLDSDFDSLGHWHYLCSCIIGILSGKKILCFPWLHKGETAVQSCRFKYLSRFAERNGIIVLIPTEELREYDRSFIEYPYNYIRYEFADNGERTAVQCHVEPLKK